MMFYIYRLVHTSGAFYIGYSKHPQSRLGLHWANCWKKRSKKDRFMAETELYDWRLEVLDSAPTLLEIREIEAHIIEKSQAVEIGLNSQGRGGLTAWIKANGSPRKGATVSAESRTKMSAAKQGNTIVQDHLYSNPERHAAWLAQMKKLGKQVYCETNQTLYASVAEAASALGVGRCDIRRVCNKTRNHVKHHVFNWYFPT
jgi:hypothetical protein